MDEILITSGIPNFQTSRGNEIAFKEWAVQEIRVKLQYLTEGTLTTFGWSCQGVRKLRVEVIRIPL